MTDAVVAQTAVDAVLPDRNAAITALDELRARSREHNADVRTLRTAHEIIDLDDVEALTGLAATEPQVTWSSRGFVSGLWAPAMRLPVAPLPSEASPRDAVRAFLRDYASLFGIRDPDRDLVETRYTQADARHIFAFTQRHAGVSVFETTLIVQLDANLDVIWVLGTLVPDLALPVAPTGLGQRDARRALGRSSYGEGELGYLEPTELGTPDDAARLVWRFNDGSRTAYVDASSGGLLRERSEDLQDLHAEVFRCSGTCSTPADVPGNMTYDDMCHNSFGVGGADICGQPAGPLCTTASYVCAGPGSTCTLANFCQPLTGIDSFSSQVLTGINTFNTYVSTRFGRDGWDNNPSSPTHRSRATAKADGWPGTTGSGTLDACGAAWSTGLSQAVFGSQRACTDVVAHEFTHGMDASGTAIDGGSECAAATAVSEGFADVFGEFVQHQSTGTTDWVHGSGCPACASARNSSLVNPGGFVTTCLSAGPSSGGCGIEAGSALLAQPDTWSEYRPDCGGHWNSTIASRIGWLMGREPAEGSATAHGVPVVGIGEVDAGGVFYRALNNDLGGAITFTQAGAALLFECSGSANYANCISAVLASGLWNGSSSAGLTVTGSASDPMNGTVDFGAFPIPTPTVRFAVYQTASGIMRRQRTCPVGSGACAWSAETALEAGAFPVQRPAVTTAPGVGVFACMVTSGHQIICDRFNGTSWAAAPSPAGTVNVQGSVSLARFNGALFLSYYQTTTGAIGLFSRRLADGASTWDPAVQIISGQVVRPAVLASSAEDFWHVTTGQLFAVWVSGASIPTLNQIWYAAFNPATGTWGGPSVVQRVLNRGSAFPTIQHYLTQSPVFAAFYRGRLHVVATNVGLEATMADSRPWYGSCAPPCTAPDFSTTGSWTPFNPQDGTMDTGPMIDSWAMQDGYLHMLHQSIASDDILNRVKFSD